LLIVNPLQQKLSLSTGLGRKTGYCLEIGEFCRVIKR